MIIRYFNIERRYKENPEKRKIVQQLVIKLKIDLKKEVNRD
jgi:hypothetical protein